MEAIKIFKLIDLLFPTVCGFCGKLDNQALCNKCKMELDKLAENQILQMKNEKINFDFCNFKELMYIFKYEGYIRNMIIDYKFNEKSYIYETFVNFVLKNKKMFEKLKTYDTIIPVPISKKRMKERGYNQSLLIAKKMSKELGITLQANCLFKTKNIVEQSKLNKEQRLQNIQNVYELKNKQILNNKTILLIDDIYTTGSTVQECSRILRQAEPKEIGVFVLARD